MNLKNNKLKLVIVFILTFSSSIIYILYNHNEGLAPSHLPEINSLETTQDEITSLIHHPQKDIDISLKSENNSDNVNMNDIDFITNDIINSANQKLLQSMLTNPRQIVKMIPNGEMPYYQVSQAFDQNDLHTFFEILNDSNSTGYERLQATNFIYQISNRGNPETIKVLKDYIQKEVNWNKWESDWFSTTSITLSKFNALDRLGYIGVKDVSGFLKKAMTTEGAKEIATQWYEGVPESSFPQNFVIENLRGSAAKALAYSDDPNIHELLRSEYEREKQALIAVGKDSDGYFNQLVEALTRIDVIKDIGIEAHKALSDGQNSYLKIYFKYQAKYSLVEINPDIEKLL